MKSFILIFSSILASSPVVFAAPFKDVAEVRAEFQRTKDIIKAAQRTPNIHEKIQVAVGEFQTRTLEYLSLPKAKTDRAMTGTVLLSLGNLGIGLIHTDMDQNKWPEAFLQAAPSQNYLMNIVKILEVGEQMPGPHIHKVAKFAIDRLIESLFVSLNIDFFSTDITEESSETAEPETKGQYDLKRFFKKVLELNRSEAVSKVFRVSSWPILRANLTVKDKDVRKVAPNIAWEALKKYTEKVGPIPMADAARQLGVMEDQFARRVLQVANGFCASKLHLLPGQRPSNLRKIPAPNLALKRIQ